MALASTRVIAVEFPKLSAASVSIPRGSRSCLLPLQEALQGQQMGLTLAPFKLLPLFWDSEHVRFCMCPLKVESLFPLTLQLSHV